MKRLMNILGILIIILAPVNQTFGKHLAIIDYGFKWNLDQAKNNRFPLDSHGKLLSIVATKDQSSFQAIELEVGQIRCPGKIRGSALKNFDRCARHFSKVMASRWDRALKAAIKAQVILIGPSYSFETTENKVSQYFQSVFKRQATLSERRLANTIFQRRIQEYVKPVFLKYSDQLIIVSAGQEGLNNDIFFRWPSNFRLPHFISVSCDGKNKGNIGHKTVDVFLSHQKFQFEHHHQWVEMNSASLCAAVVASKAIDIVTQIETSSHPTDIFMLKEMILKKYKKNRNQ